MFIELFIGNVFFFSRKSSKEEEDERESEKNDLLCRFVFDGSGRRIGETVSIDEDIIIVKSQGRYLGIPLKHIEEQDKSLLVKGLVNFDKAEEMGEQWRIASFSDVNQNRED